MQQSENIAELAKALVKAQSQIQGAKKDAINPFFKSHYADLSSVIEAIKEPLSSNGLIVTQLTDFDEGGMWVSTQISHTSGQWIRGRYPVTPTDNKPQSQGSATSYAKRYALQAALLVATEDDDGNAAQAAGKPKPAPQAAPPASKQATTTPYPGNEAEHLKLLTSQVHDVVKAKKISGAKVREIISLNWAPAEMLKDLDEKQLAKLLDALRAM